jgi:hypothetical protein
MPDGSVYPYSVGAPGAIGVDVLALFAESCTKAGLAHGFYYSFKDNFFLNSDGNGDVCVCVASLRGTVFVSLCRHSTFAHGRDVEDTHTPPHPCVVPDSVRSLPILLSQACTTYLSKRCAVLRQWGGGG